MKKLGAIGADLGAVACFFKRPWSRLSSNLSASDRAWLLNEAASRLRALGRLTEAVEPMRAGLDMDVELEEWKGAAISASNLNCDLLLSGAERAAWQLVVDSDSQIPHLESLEDVCDQVTERATQTLRIAKSHNLALLTIALDHLTLGRTALYRALLTANRAMRSSDSGASDAAIHVPQSAITHLTVAIDGLRKAGTMDHLPRGLLTRAWQRRLTDDPLGAASDLNEAAEIAERGPMPLYQADILLTRARLFGPRHDAGEYPWGSPREDLAEARRLIEQHGYHRRDQELADADAAMRR